MKRTKKNTNAFSAKVKEKLKKASSKRSTKQQAVTGPSTVTTPTPASETSVENKPLDGSMRIDHLPFDKQAKMIFNPMMGFNQKQVVGKKDGVKDPFAPSVFVVEKKK